MNKTKKNKAISQGRVAENRRAKFDYSIIDNLTPYLCHRYFR